MSLGVGSLIGLGAKHRGRHDELLRAFSAGHSLRFDILMDIGGFRDMHRHRRCVQLLQRYTDVHGYEEPVCPGQPTLAEAGLEEAFAGAMEGLMRLIVGFAIAGWRRRRSLRNIVCRWRRDAARCSRWILRRHFISRSCARGWRGTSAIGGWPGRCIGRWRRDILRWLEYFRIEDVNEPVDLLRRSNRIRFLFAFSFLVLESALKFNPPFYPARREITWQMTVVKQ